MTEDKKIAKLITAEEPAGVMVEVDRDQIMSMKAEAVEIINTLASYSGNIDLAKDAELALQELTTKLEIATQGLA